ncbi:MAG: ABC transporter ATP-binding protein/permease [Oscillospiraceae bacterium]|nr:ABC transporter ATP-binding protein/permease [Oscillospiraceae bacterium]
MNEFAKPKNTKRAIGSLLRYIGKHKLMMFFNILIAIVSVVLAMKGPEILGGATDEAFKGIMSKMTGGNEGINFDKIWSIILTLIGLYSVSAILSFIQGASMSVISAKVTYRMRKEADDKIHALPLSFFDKTTHGEVQSRISNDIDTVGMALNQSIVQTITAITQLIAILYFMFKISWELSIIAIATVPISLIGIGVIFGTSQKEYRNQQKMLGEVNGHIEEVFSGSGVVRAFNMEDSMKKKFNGLNDSLYNSSWRATFLSGIMWPITNIVGNVGYVAICIVGGGLAVAGGVTVGGIQAFIQYSRQFNQPIMQVANISTMFQQIAAASERIFEFLDEREESGDRLAPIHKSRFENPDIKFDNISFGYSADKPVIHGFSANIKNGQRIAIVGETGAGKTTIVKLLMRFYDVDSGAISIAGINVRDMQRDDLRGQMAMVLQDTWLYNDTIMENIRYGNLRASDEDVRNAAKIAQVDHFVHTLPKEYNMVLNEEADNISSGQKQLITIARAVLSNPKILILDEATSNVDTRTEVLIQKAMNNLMKGRTSFIIAHRLSTIKNADLILVMKDGNIVEQGTHNSLILRGGEYAKMLKNR